MAITITEDVSARSSTHTAKNETTYARRWEVDLDGTSAGCKTVENLWVVNTGIVRGSAYSCAGEIDLTARALDIAVKCIAEDGYTYEVICNYGKWEYSDTNPLNQPPKINYQFSDNMKIVDEDKDGNAILNSAGDPYSDPVEIYDPQLILQVSDWNVGAEPVWLGPYRNAVNSDSWRGYGPRHWRISDVQIAQVWDAEYGYYWSISLGFHFNPDTWDIRILQKGCRQLVTLPSPPNPPGTEDIRDIYISGSSAEFVGENDQKTGRNRTEDSLGYDGGPVPQTPWDFAH